jgi:DNA-directed RNA polymerase specialized sigma24 family protein
MRADAHASRWGRRAGLYFPRGTALVSRNRETDDGRVAVSMLGMRREDRDRLFLKQMDMLRRFTRVLVRDEDIADELLQDVAVVVLEHEHGPSEVASFPLWCRGIARHLTMHRRRERARLAACLEALAVAEPGAVSNDLERALMVRERIAAGLDVLDEVSQQLLFDHLLSASSMALAAQWQVSPAAIRMRLTRLRGALRSAAEEESDGDGDGYAIESSPPSESE